MPLNFYELYNLLSENTVSQEIKNLKKNIPRLSEEIEDLRKELKAAFLHLDIKDKSLDALSKWMMLLLTKSNWNISDLTHIVIDLKNEFNDFLAYSLGPDKNFNSNLLNKLNNPSFKYEDLEQLNDKYHDDLKKGSIRIPGREGQNILSFPDGYRWVNLKKGYCDIEGKSMGHCGNVGAKADDTILSLRDSRNIPHLTFVLNKGILGERKGRANTKPKEKYHPYIIELLKLPMIKGLSTGRYAPAHDFQLTDLKKEDLENLIKFKPKMENYLYLNMLLNGKQIPEEIVKKIVEDSDPNSDEEILAQKVVTAEIIKILFDKYKDKSLCETGFCSLKERNTILNIIASHDKTSSPILRELYYAHKDKDEKISSNSEIDRQQILTNVARNKNTEKSIIEELFKKYYISKNDGYSLYSEIINSIAGNPNTPAEILKKIALNDNETDWGYFVSINPSTPKENLVDMFEKGRDTVLSNYNIPEELLRKVVNSERYIDIYPDFSIQTKRLMKIAINPKCPPDILDKLSNDASYEVRERVIYNKSTPMETLEKMANDPKEFKNINTITWPQKERQRIQDLANYVLSQRLERQIWDQNPFFGER